MREYKEFIVLIRLETFKFQFTVVPRKRLDEIY